MKIKVLTYKKCGNELTDKYMELNKIADGIYITEPDKENYENVQIILEINEVFFRVDQAKKEMIEKNMNEVIEYRKNYIKNTPTLNWIQVLHIEVFKRLGLDTTPLYSRRKEIEESREKEKVRKEEERKAKQEERRLEHEKKLKEALAEFKKGERIEKDIFLELLKINNIPIHIRTVGLLNKMQYANIGETSIDFGYKSKNVNFEKVFDAARQLIKC
jgi:hypothetical protein